MTKDGAFYHIHADVAGVYETAGSDRACAWESVTAPYHGIVEQHNNRIDAGTVEAGQTGRVTVRSGEYFVFHGCQPWRYVGPD